MKRIFFILLLFISQFSFGQATGKVISNKPSGGTISWDTINVYSQLNVKQTTAGQTIAIANMPSGGKLIYVRNIGSVDVTLSPGGIVSPGYGVMLGWTGSAWNVTSKSGSSGSYLPLAGGTMTGDIVFEDGLGAEWAAGSYIKEESGVLGLSSNSSIGINSGAGIDVNANTYMSFSGGPSDNLDFNSGVDINFAPGVSGINIFSRGARFSYSTASTVPYFDASKNLISSAVTPTQLGYLTPSDATNRILGFGYSNSITTPDALKYKTVFGHNIIDGSNRGTIFGQNITTYTGLTNQVIFGDNVNVGQWMRSMVIIGNDIDASNVSLVSNAGEGVLIGNLTSSNNWKSTIVGWAARTQGVADLSIGWAADCRGTGGNHRVSIGRASTAVGAGSGVFGSHTNDDWWFGNGEVHKFVNLAGTLENVVPSTRTVTLHGPDAWDIQTVPDAFNIAGGNFRIAPGVPTGSGARAKLYFAQASGTSLGTNTKQALVNTAMIDSTGDFVAWDLMRFAKISSTASSIVASTVSTGNIATHYALKISNEATSINSKSGTTLDLKIANASRLSITANDITAAVPINKITITAPATGSTLTIADGKTLTQSNTLTFTGTDGSSVNFGTGGPVAYNDWSYSFVSGSNATTSSASLVDVTGLSNALAANTTYEFEATVSVASSSAAGTQYGMQYSAAGASIESGFVVTNTATTVKSGRISAFNTPTVIVMGGAIDGQLQIKGIVRTGANAGNLTVQHLKATSGTSTVYIDSFLKVKKIN